MLLYNRGASLAQMLPTFLMNKMPLKILKQKILIPKTLKLLLLILLITALHKNGFTETPPACKMMLLKTLIKLLKIVTETSFFFIVARSLNFSLESIVMTREEIRLALPVPKQMQEPRIPTF